MLSNLSIKNYALIESVQLDFSDGFTVITGETGAGKSILLGALGLITGKRADSSSAGDPNLKCIVEGTFYIEGYDLDSFFKENDLDYEPHSIIRRELLPSGKSRAFINDTPVTLAQLQLLGSKLIDIHSQNKTLDVVAQSYQLEMLDTFSNNLKQLDAYQSVYGNLQKKRAHLSEILEKKKQAQLEYDYQSFLFKELDEAALKKGEYEEIETEFNTLSNADEIMQELAVAANKVASEETGALDALTEARASLARLSKYGKQYEDLHNRLQSVFLELDDISSSLTDTAAEIEADPIKLERLNNRMQLIYSLLQKHHVATVEELIDIRDKIDFELQDLQGADNQIEIIKKEIETLQAEAVALASTLHKDRKTAIPHLQSLVEKILLELGMPNAQFVVELKKIEELRLSGGDLVEFQFTANKGSTPKALGKGASGGELSRVMLALKSVLSSHKKLTTLIFDEIDTGVSGDIAVKMGGILKKMGHTMQLISITHLPQIAGQGNAHFKVYKKDVNDRTQTNILRLSDDQRIVEIAAMLGGTQGNTAAIAHAKTLLN